jgi:lipopolysaccharide transport system ATP-binding protein
MSPAIEASNLGKRYVLAHRREPYLSLREAISHWARTSAAAVARPFTGSPAGDGSREDFWALRDVSFRVEPGERLGIIGRNGAGKSTLLKILSRITEPSTGRVRITGRLASLLEVGTGFHPELTGRENVFLNGSILGMGRAEIRRKFDEIVAFAEVEKFLDTPVKRYSSGMYVRLAFAVAAHLEPEILVVDEVLAVGDAAFQRKCLGKMDQVGREGRTVIFVSHSMAAVDSLCTTGMVIEQGCLALRGTAKGAIEHYMASLPTGGGEDLRARTDRKGDGTVRVTRMVLVDGAGTRTTAFPVGSHVTFRLDYEAPCGIARPRVILGVYDMLGAGVARFDTDVAGGLPEALAATGTITCEVEALALTPGRYSVNLAFLAGGVMRDYLVGATALDLVDADFFGTGKSFTEGEARLTKVYVPHGWNYRS